MSLTIAHRAVLLYAQSGAGKTSLLNAGLLPLLEEEGFDIIPVTRVQGPIPNGINPREIPNIYVFNSLLRWAGDQTDSRRLLETTLRSFLKDREHRTSEDGLPVARIIIFDQFEELFTFYPERWENRADFFEQLAEAQNSDPLLRVVFAMREDSIAQLDSFAHLIPERLRTRLRLERLREDAALLALTRPLEGTEVTFGANVAQKLVGDLLQTRAETATGEIESVRGEYVEPVQLQVVCQSLWKELPRDIKEITMDHLLKFGDPDRALARFYEDALQTVEAETRMHENDVRRWCETSLITSTGTRGFVHRDPNWNSELHKAVEILEDAHLIRSERRAGSRWYELTHDRFIEPIRHSNEDWKKQCALKGEEIWSTVSRVFQVLNREVSNRELRKCLEDSEGSLAMSKNFGIWKAAAYALSLIGDIHNRLESHQEALRAYYEAHELYQGLGDDASLNQLVFAIAGTLHASEQNDAAIQWYTSYINQGPSDYEGYDGRAAAYWYSGQYEAGVADFTKALELNGDYFNGYNGRGQCLADLGQYERARVDLDKAVNLGADQIISPAYALNGRAFAYAGLGLYEQALEEFSRSLAISPNNAWAYFNRARTHEWMQLFDEAVRDYEISLKKNAPRLCPHKREQARVRLRELAERTG